MAEKETERPIRLLVAERRELTRTLIRMALDGFDDIELVSETDNGLATVTSARDLSPDVIIVRGDLPRYNGFQTTRRLTKEDPGCAVLIIHDEQPRSTLEAVKVGAVGYITENNDLSDLHAAIRSVARGHSFVPLEQLRSVLHGLEESTPASESRPIRDLSSRQREILVLIAAGRSAAEIGLKLHISPATVRSHMTRIRKRVGSRSPADMIRLARSIENDDVTETHPFLSSTTVA